MPLTTVINLRAAILRELWGGRHPLVSTTTAVGTSTTLAISSAAYSGGATSDYGGTWVFIAELVGAGPAVGEISKVTSTGFTIATGVFTVSPAYTAALDTGTDVQFYYGLHPDEILQAINRIQNSIPSPAYLPLGGLNTHDMESTTSMTAVGAGTTLAKQTTASRVAIGLRSQNVITTVVTTGVTTPTFDVHEGDVLTVSVALRVPTGDAEVVLRNITAGSDTRRVRSINDSVWTEGYFTETVPANCEQMAVRVLADTTAASEFDVGWITVYSNSYQQYILPSQIEYASGQLAMPLWYVRQGSAAEATDTYRLDTEYLPWAQAELIEDWRAANPNRLQLPLAATRPVLYQFKRPGPDLANADSTELPEGLVVAGVMADLKGVLAARTANPMMVARLVREAGEFTHRYNRLKREYGIGTPVIEMGVQHRVWVR